MALNVGDVLLSGGRTVTDAEIALLPAMMGAINPLFHDATVADASRMGGRILYGPAALGIAIALTEPVLKDKVQGLVEISSLKFRAPVFSGDTLRAKLEVVDVESREDKRGSLMTTSDVVLNQNDVTVMTFTRRILLK
ncbi:MaoC family dehydratase [Ornithinimicrobium faecis]|uniref:MaoC family dehydratase n=1 Tax=Ornithinimicrobium faecis TaxID=2934158 RepID=UPI0021196385|nr:MaoC/PaaZ C-terminal domain-containing protein [Ornithinimicrobium sp. HY1745]